MTPGAVMVSAANGLRKVLGEEPQLSLFDYVLDLYFGRSTSWSKIFPKPSEAAEAKIQADLRRYVDSVRSQFKYLFSLVCGIGDALDEESQILSAAVYPGAAWSSGFGCQLVFHRDRQEYRRDLGRIFAEYMWGTYASQTMIGVWTLHDLKTSERFARNKVSRRDWINELLNEKNAGYFARYLAMERDYLDKISAEDMERILASDWVPSVACLEKIERETCVVVDDFGDNGLALSSIPYEEVDLAPAWFIVFDDALSHAIR